MKRIFGRVLVKETASAAEPRNISRREVCFCKRLNFVLIRPFFRLLRHRTTSLPHSQLEASELLCVRPAHLTVGGSSQQYDLQRAFISVAASSNASPETLTR